MVDVSEVASFDDSIDYRVLKVPVYYLQALCLWKGSLDDDGLAVVESSLFNINLDAISICFHSTCRLCL